MNPCKVEMDSTPPATRLNVSYIRSIRVMTPMQKGDLLTTETTEITETKDNLIFH